MPDRVVTVTLNPSVDRSCRTERMLPDKKLRCDSVRRDPGGGGVNVARVLTRLGVPARAMYSAGGDTGGDLGELLDAENVRQEPVPIEATTRENVFVYEEIEDRQYRLNMPGAPLTRAEQEFWIHRLGALTPTPRVVVMSGSLPPQCPAALVGDLIEEIESGVSVVLDTSGEALRMGLDAGVRLVKPNRRELAELVGQSLETDEDVRQAAESIVDDGGASMVLTSLGEGGAMLVTADECIRIEAPKVHLRSRIGAGDSMVAGAVYGLLAGYGCRHIAAFAVAAGTAATMTDGTELCRPADVHHLMQRIIGMGEMIPSPTVEGARYPVALAGSDSMLRRT